VGGGLGTAEDAGDAGEEVGAGGEVGGGEELFGGVGVDGEPVAVVVAAAVTPEEVGIGREDVVEPADHAIEVLHEEAGVGVVEVEGPGEDDSGVAPDGSAVAERVEAG